MNKEFSNKIMVCPFESIPAIVAHPFTGFTELHSNVDVVPNTPQKQASGNPYFEFNLRTTHTELSAAQLALVSNNRRLVLLLFDHSGNHYQVGTASIPVIPELNQLKFNGELKFTARLLNLPF